MECKRERQKYCFSEDKSKCEGANEYGVKNEDQPCDSCDGKYEQKIL